MAIDNNANDYNTDNNNIKIKEDKQNQIKQPPVYNKMDPDKMQRPERPLEQSSINKDEGENEDGEIENDNNNIELYQESKEEEEEKELFDHIIKTRSRRVSKPVHKYVMTHQGHL
jgi:hypothetical protein